MIPKDLQESVVGGLLAVGGWDLPKMMTAMDAMRKGGLFDLNEVSKLSVVEICSRFIEHGYNRGNLNSMMADRLLHVAQTVMKGDLDPLLGHLEKGRRYEAFALLTSIKYVGLKVAENVLSIAGSYRKEWKLS